MATVPKTPPDPQKKPPASIRPSGISRYDELANLPFEENRTKFDPPGVARAA